MAGFELNGFFEGLNGLDLVPLGLGDAGDLVVELGAVLREFLELAEDVPGLLQFALGPVDAGPLELDLRGGVAGLLGLVEGLEGVVVLVPVDQGLAQIEVAERGLDLLQVGDRVAHVAEEVIGDAELQVQLLGQGRRGAFEALAQVVVNVLEGLELGPALGEPLAELLDGAGVTVLALDQERLQINGLVHGLTPGAIVEWLVNG